MVHTFSLPHPKQVYPFTWNLTQNSLPLKVAFIVLPPSDPMSMPVFPLNHFACFQASFHLITQFSSGVFTPLLCLYHVCLLPWNLLKTRGNWGKRNTILYLSLNPVCVSDFGIVTQSSWVSVLITYNGGSWVYFREFIKSKHFLNNKIKTFLPKKQNHGFHIFFCESISSTGRVRMKCDLGKC